MELLTEMIRMRDWRPEEDEPLVCFDVPDDGFVVVFSKVEVLPWASE